MDTYILNIETSTKVCSVALSKNGTLLNCVENDEGLRHASVITLLIKECLEASSVKISNLNAIAISSGPGSYTSLRVGCSTAKGICYAQDIPLIGVSTLECLAREGRRLFPEIDFIVPMIDARRMEVYANLMEKNQIIKKNFNIIVKENTFSDIFTTNKHILAIGNGALKTQSVINNENYKTFPLACSAKYMIPISHLYYQNRRFEDLAYFVPDYLKLPNITSPKSRLL